MARTESVTREDILNTAFAMAREEGAAMVTARRLAARAGCSTQPVFRVYNNMEELMEELFHKAADFFEEFQLSYSQSCRQAFPRQYRTPFLNLGMAYIQFAEADKHLFELLFLSPKRYGKTLYDLVNGRKGVIVKEVAKAADNGCRNPGGLFMKMWIFIHGAACMALTGDYDLTAEETADLLEDSYKAFSV